MRYHKTNGEEVIVYTKEEKLRALQVSLISLAASLGYTPVRQGAHYSLKEMDSLIIYNDRTWNRWSGKGSHTGGTQIDFLLEFGGIDNVPEAVQYLLEFNGEIIQDIYIENGERESANKEFKLPEKNSNFRRLYAYLMKTRGLSQDVVSYFVKNRLIYEDAAHHNIVYCGYDPEGNIRYAGLRGTADAYGKKFKMDVPGNDKNYGVNIVNRKSSTLKVFEAVIDCMSYIDMTGDYTSNKLILGMVEDNPLEQFLKDYSHIKHIIFCLDNDAAGQEAIYTGKKLANGTYKPGLKEKYEKKGYEVSVEKPASGKDFNECLLSHIAEHTENAAKPMSINKRYVEDFYNQMMKIVGYQRGIIQDDERMATIKYESAGKEVYLSDGFGDCYAWIKEQETIPQNLKIAAAKHNQITRNICVIKNQQGEIGFYMENSPKERYKLSNVDGLIYNKDQRYKIYYNFDGVLTRREMDKLYSICEYLEKKSMAETQNATGYHKHAGRR